MRAWSAGCGAGEEPYTLAIAWAIEIPSGALEVVATDIDDVQLGRARVACYPTATLRELPAHWREAAFDERDGEVSMCAPYRTIQFTNHDLKSAPLPGPFDLVLCRNLAFSYFDEATQRAVTESFRSVLRTGGVLVVGGDECLPDGAVGFEARPYGIYVAI